MRFRNPLLLVLVITPGLAATGVSGYYVLQDWASLNRSFARWEFLAQSGADARSLGIAETYQNAFRINCFADGVGVLPRAILFAIGLCALLGNEKQS